MNAPLRRERGLTLIELVVVMAILVILTGLALPKLDVFKLKSGKAQAASNMYSVNNFVTAYWAQHDVFPDIWDSLLESPGAGTPGTTLYSKLHPSLTGAPGGTAQKLATTTLTAQEIQSLNRVGIFQVVDHDPSVSFPNNSSDFSTLRTLQAGDAVATLNSADPKAGEILLTFYPDLGGAAPAGKKVVVFGLGPFNETIGDTLHAPPIYGYGDQLTQYMRMLVVFEVDSGGGRAKLLGSLGADGDTMEGELQDFYKL